MGDRQLERIAKTFIWLGLLLIALLFIKAGKNLFDSVYLLKYGIPIDGLVIKKKIIFNEGVRHGFSNSRDTFEEYVITVEYRDSVGQKFSTEFPVNEDLFSSIKERQVVRILYDKSSPTRACLFDMRYQALLMPAIAVMFGLVFGCGLWVLKNRFPYRLS